MSKAKIRIFLQSFNLNLIIKACKRLMEVTKSCEKPSNIKGPIFLPTRKRVYCVLRSPYVNKDSQEQFEIRQYKRIIDVYPTKEDITTDKILKTQVPCGVSARIEITRRRG